MRRRKRGREGESWGTPLADILTTALGAVLLLFMIVVMHGGATLSQEKAEHARTRNQLASDRANLSRAEARRRAQMTAAQRAAAAKGQAQAALRASEAELRSLKGENDALRTANAEITALQAEIATLKKDHDGLRSAAKNALVDLDPHTASPVDVVLVIDGTRSMKPSLESTRANLTATIEALRVVSPTARIGVTVFRDKREKKSLRLQSHPLTSKAGKLRKFLGAIQATSTRRDKDLPEWLCGGIEAAAKARWREGAIKLMIVVSDAGAQDKGAAACLAAAEAFAEAGGQLHTITTRPRGYGKIWKVTRNWKKVVLPQHAAIAAAGGGLHVDNADSNDLLTAVLRAAFRERTRNPLERLREAVTD